MKYITTFLTDSLDRIEKSDLEGMCVCVELTDDEYKKIQGDILLRTKYSECIINALTKK